MRQLISYSQHKTPSFEKPGVRGILSDAARASVWGFPEYHAVKPENDEIVLKETLIFEVTGFDEYSENLIKSSTIKVLKIDFGKESIAETREIPYNNAV